MRDSKTKDHLYAQMREIMSRTKEDGLLLKQDKEKLKSIIALIEGLEKNE